MDRGARTSGQTSLAMLGVSELLLRRTRITRRVLHVGLDGVLLHRGGGYNIREREEVESWESAVEGGGGVRAGKTDSGPRGATCVLVALGCRFCRLFAAILLRLGPGASLGLFAFPGDSFIR